MQWTKVFFLNFNYLKHLRVTNGGVFHFKWLFEDYYKTHIFNIEFPFKKIWLDEFLHEFFVEEKIKKKEKLKLNLTYTQIINQKLKN